jgi:hypothetical protein
VLPIKLRQPMLIALLNLSRLKNKNKKWIAMQPIFYKKRGDALRRLSFYD